MRVTATVLKRRARVLPALCLAIGLSGCFWARGSGEARGMIGWKTVMRKMDPVYLIAVDGSQCTVTEEKFKKAKEGERFFCAWSGGAVATRPEGRPYPDEDVGIPRDPAQPHVPPPSPPRRQEH
jgi:hypothetical protein